MRLLILSCTLLTCTLLLLPTPALAQFEGFGSVDATTPTFNGSSTGGHKTTGPSSRLGTGIATPGGRQGPISTGPTIYRAPQPRVARTDGGGRSSGGGSCPRAGAGAAQAPQQPAPAPARTTASTNTSAGPGR